MSLRIRPRHGLSRSETNTLSVLRDSAARLRQLIKRVPCRMLRSQYRSANPLGDVSNTAVIAAAPRGGSTWLCETLAFSFELDEMQVDTAPGSEARAGDLSGHLELLRERNRRSFATDEGGLSMEQVASLETFPTVLVPSEDRVHWQLPMKSRPEHDGRLRPEAAR